MIVKKLLATCAALTYGLLLMAQPKAFFIKTDHDFGEVQELYGKVQTEYKVVNLGNQPLRFTEVRPSCGCTEPEWTKTDIAPGDSGFIRAIFDPTNRPGQFEKVVYVRTNGEPVFMVLTFRGNVIPRPFEITEKYPLEFGKLRMENNYVSFGESFMGEIDSASIKVYNQSDEEVWITNIVNTPGYVNFEIPNLRLKPKEESVIKAKYHTKASGKYGEANYVFYMNTSDSVFTSNVPIFAGIHVREKFPKMTKKQLENAPKIQVDAHMLHLGKILEGDSVEFQYTITNTGKDPLVIRNVTALCGCTASVIDKKKLKRGESTVVRAKFRSEGREGPQEKYITVISTDPVTPELRIGFKAEVVTNPNAVKY